MAVKPLSFQSGARWHWCRCKHKRRAYKALIVTGLSGRFLQSNQSFYSSVPLLLLGLSAGHKRGDTRTVSLLTISRRLCP